MTKVVSPMPTSADEELKASVLKIAEDDDNVADVFDAQAQSNEEAGITGIHPSAPMLRQLAQAKRKCAADWREWAATLA